MEVFDVKDNNSKRFNHITGSPSIGGLSKLGISGDDIITPIVDLIGELEF